jgi:hypothetical protein
MLVGRSVSRALTLDQVIPILPKVGDEFPMTRTAYRYVYELPDKLAFLMKQAFVLGAVRLADQKSLALSLGVDKSVLSRLRNYNHQYFCQMPETAIRRLGEIFGFDPNSWQEWSDATASAPRSSGSAARTGKSTSSPSAKDVARIDTAERFADRYVQEADRTELRSKHWRVQDIPSLRQISASEPLPRVFSAEWVIDPSDDSNLKTKLRGRLSFGTHPVGEIGDVAVIRGRLNLKPYAVGVERDSRLGYDRAVGAPDGSVGVRLFGGPDDSNWEIVQLNEGPLPSCIHFKDPPLCIFGRLDSDGRLEICFSAFPKHLKLVGLAERQLPMVESGQQSDPSHESSDRSVLVSRLLAAFVAKKLRVSGDEVVLGEYAFIASSDLAEPLGQKAS